MLSRWELFDVLIRSTGAEYRLKNGRRLWEARREHVVRKQVSAFRGACEQVEGVVREHVLSREKSVTVRDSRLVVFSRMEGGVPLQEDGVKAR